MPDIHKDAYRRIAKRYDQIFESLNAGLYSVGMKMHPPSEEMDVLDVGCGTGTQLARYQKAGCKLFGIDTSPAMLDVAHAKLGEHVGLHLGDAAMMPYADNSFDLVVSTLVLHEMSPDLRSSALNEIKRVLKKEGRFLVIEFHRGTLKPFKGWLFKAIITISEIAAGRKHFKHYRHFMANKGLPALAANHSFTIEKQRVVSGGNMGIFVLRAD